MTNSNSDVNEGELPQLLDEEPIGKLEVARELIDRELEKAPADADAIRSIEYSDLALEDGDFDDIGLEELGLAVSSVDQAIREGRV